MAIIRHTFPNVITETLSDDEFARLYTEALFILQLNKRTLENAMLTALAKVFAKK
jgi:hypothetical protein